MLDVEKIQQLYKSLPVEDKKIINEKLFKNSRQSMAYFNRQRNITFAKLEIIADFFGVTLDYLRKRDNIEENTSNSTKGTTNKTESTRLSAPNSAVDRLHLEKEIELLKQRLYLKHILKE